MYFVASGPAAPWNIWTQNVKDYSNGFYKGYFDGKNAYQFQSFSFIGGRIFLYFPFVSWYSLTVQPNWTKSFQRLNTVKTGWKILKTADLKRARWHMFAATILTTKQKNIAGHVLTYNSKNFQWPKKRLDIEWTLIRSEKLFRKSPIIEIKKQ